MLTASETIALFVGLIASVANVVELFPPIDWFAAPLKVTVFDAAVNVPLLIQLPPSLMSPPGA